MNINKNRSIKWVDENNIFHNDIYSKVNNYSNNFPRSFYKYIDIYNIKIEYTNNFNIELICKNIICVEYYRDIYNLGNKFNYYNDTINNKIIDIIPFYEYSYFLLILLILFINLLFYL